MRLDPRKLPIFALPCAVYLAYVVVFCDYVNDDAYITFRYSVNLANGLGPVYNPGEHVEGYTNFSWMLIMALVAWIGKAAWLPVTAKVLGALAGGLAIAGAAVLTILSLNKETDSALGYSAALAGSLGVAASPAFVVNALSGLETSLYSCLIVLGVLLGMKGFEKNRWFGAGAALAVAALTRPEGIAVFCLYAAAFVLAAILAKRKETFRLLTFDAVVFAVAVAGHFLFRYLYYEGEILPNTYYAKQGGIPQVPVIPYILNGSMLPFLAVKFEGYVLPLGVLAAVFGLFLNGKGLARPMLLFPAVVGWGGVCLPLITGTDWMIGWRLVVPYLPLAAVPVAAGWIGLAKDIKQRFPRALLAPGLAAIAAVFEVSTAAGLDTHNELDSRAYHTGHRTFAYWVKGEAGLPPGSTIALMDIGQVGFICMDYRILDITGLTDREIAKSPGPFLRKKYDPDLILNREPDVVMIRVLLPPNEPGQIRFLTQMGSTIYNAPAFQQRYLSPPDGKAQPPEDWVEAVTRDTRARIAFPFVTNYRQALLVFIK